MTGPTHLTGTRTGARRTLCGIKLNEKAALPYGHAYYVGRRKVEPDYCPDCLDEHHANEATKATPDPMAWLAHRTASADQLDLGGVA